MHRKQLSAYLKQLGFSPSQRGYWAIHHAIFLALENPYLLNSATKSLYPIIASKMNTSVPCVERNIRNAIEKAWTNGNFDFITEVFKSSIGFNKSRPSNLQFLTTMTEYVRYEFMFYNE